MRFCSANQILPAEVDESVVDRLLAYRRQIGKACDDAFRRLLARAWNGNVGTMSGLAGTQAHGAAGQDLPSRSPGRSFPKVCGAMSSDILRD